MINTQTYRAIISLLIGSLLAAWPVGTAGAQCTYSYTWDFNNGSIAPLSSTTGWSLVADGTGGYYVAISGDHQTTLLNTAVNSAFGGTVDRYDFATIAGDKIGTLRITISTGGMNPQMQSFNVAGDGAFSASIGAVSTLPFVQHIHLEYPSGGELHELSLIIPCNDAPNVTPTNTPSPTDTPTPGPSPTPTDTPVPTDTPTPTYTPTPGPSPTPTDTPTPTPTPFDNPIRDLEDSGFYGPGGPSWLQPYNIPDAPGGELISNPLWDVDAWIGAMRSTITVLYLSNKNYIPSILIIIGAYLFVVKGLLGRGGSGGFTPTWQQRTLPKQPGNMRNQMKEI